MNKSLISILLVVFLAVISGCADTGSGGGTGSVDGAGSSGGTGSGDPSAIPEGGTIVLTKDTSSEDVVRTESKPVEITNPRKDAGKYYPILISTAMGLNGESGDEMSNMIGTTVKGVGYITYFGSKMSGSKLVFGEKDDMYDLTSETALNASGQDTYYVSITQWNGAMPSEGKLVIAFLSKKEANEYIPSNNNIVLMPDSSTMTYNPKFLDNTIVDELNKLGALRQYTFTVK